MWVFYGCIFGFCLNHILCFAADFEMPFFAGCILQKEGCGHCPTPGDSYSGSSCINCCWGAVGPPWGLEFAQAILPYPLIAWNVLIHTETMHPAVLRVLSGPPCTTETMLLKQDFCKTKIKGSEATGYKKNKYKTKLKRQESVLLCCKVVPKRCTLVTSFWQVGL